MEAASAYAERAEQDAPWYDRVADTLQARFWKPLARRLRDPAKQLLRKPRGRDDMQAVGVFAQRTKYRPNPLGITAVQLLGIEGNVVKVRGQSMIDGHIADGDYVVIRKQDTCENGEKVIAMVDRAMTLKKYYKKKDQIRLEPMNSTMEPIFVDPTRQDVRILGVLAGVIRKY